LTKGGARIDGFAGAPFGDRKLVERALRERPDFARERDSGGLTALQCAAGSRLPGAPVADVARLLLDAGAEVGALTKSWNHDVDALYFAVGANHGPIVEMLLEHGADPTATLAHAVWATRTDMAELALDRGADPDRATANGKPLLNDLIRWGQIPGVMWMLAHGASPNIPDDHGWTAVHQAASRGNARILKAVLEAGGNFGRPDHDGHTPIDIARKAGKGKLVAMMP
jgi:ankyrin repeat protein